MFFTEIKSTEPRLSNALALESTVFHPLIDAVQYAENKAGSQV